jgi:hypothetical protein
VTITFILQRGEEAQRLTEEQFEASANKGALMRATTTRPGRAGSDLRRRAGVLEGVDAREN